MTDTGDDGPRPMGWWDMLLDDVAASAAEYEERGWDALQLHTADATPLDGTYGDDVGLSVLVPDDEFETLASWLAEGGVDGFEAYRTTVMGYVALLVALEDETNERAILLPAYYSTADDRSEGLFAQALEEGELTVFLRNLAEDRVEVTLSQPGLLAPPETGDGESAADDGGPTGSAGALELGDERPAKTADGRRDGERDGERDDGETGGSGAAGEEEGTPGDRDGAADDGRDGA